MSQRASSCNWSVHMNTWLSFLAYANARLFLHQLFGFGVNNYYRDVLVHFAFIAGFGICVIVVVYLKVRERR